MLRNILVLFPALVLALGVVTPQSSSAGEPRWGGGKYEPTQEPGGIGGDLELVLAMCTEVQVLVENRACQLVRANEGIAVCDARYMKPGKKPGKKPVFPGQEPVFPGQEPVFPGQEPVYPGQEPVFPDQEPFYPDQKGEHGGMIFVDITQCAALGINIQGGR